MPKILPSGVDLTVKMLSNEGMSPKEILRALKRQNIDITVRTINNIKRNVGQRRQALIDNRTIPQRRNRRAVRTCEAIRKVRNMANKENPPSQRSIANQCSISQTSVNRILHKDLQLKTRIKSAVHKLTEAHIKNRKTNVRKLYERRLAGDKSEFVVTLDEAFVYLDDTNRNRRICYVKVGKDIPHEWVYERIESFKKGFMIVGAITGRGVLPLIRVLPNAKINANYYVNNVLRPLIEEELPKLYPDDLNKVFIHHDKCSSHTAFKTQQYLEDVSQRLGVSVIRNEEIPVKSPDVSPLDFFGFGFLKQRLFPRRVKTLYGLWKVCKQEWFGISPELVVKVFNNWKKRCRLVMRHKGKHIENTKAIHNKIIRL